MTMSQATFPTEQRPKARNQPPHATTVWGGISENSSRLFLGGLKVEK